ncbi:MAG: phosphoenolpyruvate carboxykinase (ATP) [Flavobacteriales bacterium]
MPTSQKTLSPHGINTDATVYWNLLPSELVEKTINLKQGVLANTGSLVVDTGKFSGRVPKDRYFVKDKITENKIHWGSVNISVEEKVHENLYKKVCAYFSDKDIYVQECGACADPKYRMKIRVIAENPWSALFAHNMFLRYTRSELKTFSPDWTVICAPGFKADPKTDGVKNEHFIIINFSKKNVLIGGTGYTGEIKKSIFTILNFLLPVEHKIFPMHSSANIGLGGDVAIFFGLSGTGKTTLSNDPYRKLIGDDEHAWTDHSVFNFEGGCYAKVIDIRPDTEPLIYNAIKFGALLENVKFFPHTRQVNYHDISKTENTRVSYPMEYIPSAVTPSYGPPPKHVFFLTCDAFGVLPPVSRLTKAQAMYHFVSGYTSKVPGTEDGVSEPQVAFSAGYGEPFLPLHPIEYAHLLGEKMEQQNVKIWLVNTGWIGGGFGVGHRMRLDHTRLLLSSAMNGELERQEFENEAFFGLSVPKACHGIPENILNPKLSWKSEEEYDKTARLLAEKFTLNFKKFEDQATPEILAAGPLQK